MKNKSQLQGHGGSHASVIPARHHRQVDNNNNSGLTYTDAIDNTKVLREVDRFVMSLPLGDAPGDAEIEEAVAKRLFQAEAERQKAQAKTKEWMQVAEELKQVLHQQQLQLHASQLNKSSARFNTHAEEPPLRQTASRSNKTAKPYRESASVPVSQLQQLVDNIRSELQGNVGSGGAASSKQYHTVNHPVSRQKENRRLQQVPDSDSRTEVVLLKAGLDAVRQQLEQMQQQHTERDRGFDEQVTAAYKAQEVSRKALLEAEMELQASTEQAAELRKKLALLEEEVKCKSDRIDDMQKDLKSASHRAQATDTARFTALSEVNQLRAEAVQLESQLQAAKAAAERSVQAAEEAERRVATAEAAAASDRQRRTAAELTVVELEAGLAELQASAAAQTRRTKQDVTALSAQADAIAADLHASQEAAQEAQQQAYLAREEADSLRRTLAATQEQWEATRGKLAATQGEVQLLTQRVAQAEANIGVPPAALAEAQRNHETEIRGLRELMDTVSSAARQRDTQLSEVTAQRDKAIAANQHAVAAAVSPWQDKVALLTNQLQQMQQRLASTQSAAAAEFGEWEKNLKEVTKARNTAQMQLTAAQARIVVLKQTMATLQQQVVTAKDMRSIGETGEAEKTERIVLNISVQDSPALISDKQQQQQHATPTKASVEPSDQAHANGFETPEPPISLSSFESVEALEAAALAAASPESRKMHQAIIDLKRHHAAHLATLKEQNELLRRRAATVQSQLDAIQDGSCYLWRVGEGAPPPLAQLHQQELDKLMQQHEQDLDDLDAKWRAEVEEVKRTAEAAAEAAELQHVQEIENAFAAVKAATANAEGKEEHLKLQARARSLEGEILAAQDRAAHLNSMMDKLEGKTKRYKEELATARSELASQTQRAEQFEAALADAQDEVEALLTQRLQDFNVQQQQPAPSSRPASPLKKFANMVKGGFMGKKQATPHPKKFQKRLNDEVEEEEEEQDQDEYEKQQQHQVDENGDDGYIDHVVHQHFQQEEDVDNHHQQWQEQEQQMHGSYHDESNQQYITAEGDYFYPEEEQYTAHNEHHHQQQQPPQHPKLYKNNNDAMMWQGNAAGDAGGDDEDWQLAAGTHRNDLYVSEGGVGAGGGEEEYYYSHNGGGVHQ